MASARAGRYVSQPGGFRAFIPAPLPPVPPLAFDDELTRFLSEADQALGRLDGAASILPNPELFVAMYVRREAVYSSQIEGTQSTLEDVLEFEAGGGKPSRPKDVKEVVNYVRAMDYGLRRLTELPVCLRLIREIHAELLKGVRGADRTPGEFRRSQNWIGPEGTPLAAAIYVPPPVHEMQAALGDLEKFLHQRGTMPLLVHCGLAHAQLETIHPFLDGNGRVGRLLITFLLCWQGALQRPLLYLSHYFKAHRAEYYDRLMAIRNDGNWEGWLKFFLSGVRDVSVQATETARQIIDLREQHRRLLAGSAYDLKLVDHLFQTPIVSVPAAQKILGCSSPTAYTVIGRLVKQGLLQETTGRRRDRWYRYKPYLDLFEGQNAPTT